MSLYIDQAKTRLSLPTQQTPAEVKILIKDIYEKLSGLSQEIERLNNEIRKVSENRARAGKDSGRNLHTS